MPTYTNLFTNPRPDSASSLGWGSAAGTGGAVTNSTLTGVGGPGGDTARRVAWTTGATNSGGNIFVGNSSVGIPIGAGVSASGTAWVRTSKDQQMLARLTFYSDAYITTTGTSDGPVVALTANTWTEVKYEGVTTPAGTINGRLVFPIDPTTGIHWATGDTLDVAAATLVQSATVPQPFHGGLTSSPPNTYAWTGAADASTSTLTVATSVAPPTNLAVTPVTPTRLDVSWTAASGALGYDVERDGTVIVSGQAGTTYSDTGLTPGQTYSYRVRSVA